MNNDFITDGKEFFVGFETPLVSGYLPVPIPKADPVLNWHGPKIHLLNSWYPALKFMAEHVEHEVVLRLFMTRARDEIIIFPLSQIYGTGMSVKEEITKEEREWWGSEGLIEAGTMHSHCNSGAFASGTDKDDERNRDGLHVTIGKLKGTEYDLHARMTWTIPGEERDGKLVRASMTTSQKPNLRDWFTLPDHVEAFITAEPELEESVIKYVLCKPPTWTTNYPAEWKDKLIRQKFGTDDIFKSTGKTYMNPSLQFSMADDIPGWKESKKKDYTGNNQKKPGPNLDLKQDVAENIKRRNLLWDIWSEALAIIADSYVLRAAQVSVDDFDPQLRPILIKQHPEALAVWKSISELLLSNGITEKEFFEEWGDHRLYQQ